MATATEQAINTANVDIKIVALCPGCKNIQPIEACLDCFIPLCSVCMKYHYEELQRSIKKHSKQCLQKADKYLEKISALNPLIKENEAKIIIVKTEIEETFEILIEKLNKEKSDIFNMLDQIQSDNQQYKTFENSILELKSDFKDLEVTIKNPTNDSRHALEINQFKQCKDRVKSIAAFITHIKNKPFKIIGDYEKPKTLESNFFGNLIISESESVLKHQKEVNLSRQNSEVKKDKKVSMFGTLNVRLKQIAEQYNDFKHLFKIPSFEFETQIQPQILSSFKSLIFITDESGNLALMESNGILKPKLETKLGILNIKGIGVNQTYLAATFSDLNKESIKTIGNKKIKTSSGIILFKWNESFKFEKVIDKPDFKSPSSLAVNEEFIFVTDRELNSILKFDIKTGNLLKKLVVKDCHPTGICFYDNNYLAFADSFKHEINLIDSENLNKKSDRTVKISDEYKSLNGAYDLVMKNNNFLFVKSRSDTRVIIYDLDLSFKNCFEHDFSGQQGITLVNGGDNADGLVIGRIDAQKNYKLSYFKDF